MRSENDDRTHLREAGAGSEAAFLALVDRHHASLLRVARLWVADTARCEALVQKTWLALLRRLGRFDDQSSLKGWLCGALIRETQLELGPEHEAAFELSEDGEVPAVEPERFSPPGDRWEGHWQKPPVDWPNAASGSPATRAQRTVIDEVIARLSPAQRIVLVLRDVEGLTNREVQQALGASHEQQHVLLHRARSRVRAALESHHWTTANADNGDSVGAS